MSSPAGNLEKRYLINFRQVLVIALQSHPVNGQVFEPVAAVRAVRAVPNPNLIFTPTTCNKGAVIFRCFPINIAPLTTVAHTK